MNLSMLSVKEILRVCDPKTELENRLMAACQDLDDECDSLRHEVEEIQVRLDDTYCDSCADASITVKVAVDSIESGKVNDGVAILKRLI